MKAAIMSAALAGLMAAAAASASTPVIAETAALRAALSQVQGAQAAPSGEQARPAELVDFDYHRFFERAFRLGLPTQRIGYVLTVGPDGKATDCTLSMDYRYEATDRQMCRQIKRVTRFTPARDAQGNPVTGTYSGEVMLVNIILYDR